MADPMYPLIADDLRREIEISGGLAPGQPAPHRARAEGTVRRVPGIPSAMPSNRSSAWGWWSPRPGQGTYVTEHIDPFVTTLSADAKSGFGGGEGTSYLSEVSRADRVPRHRHAPGGDLGRDR